MTWLFDAVLLLTGLGAVFGTAHFLAWRTEKQWAWYVGAGAVALLIGLALMPLVREWAVLFFFSGSALGALASGICTGQARRPRERGAGAG